MSRIQEKLLLALADFVALNLSTMGLLWTKHFLLRAVRVGGMLDSAEQAWRQTHGVSSSPTLFFVVEYYSLAIGLIYVLWLVLFVSFGLYRTPRLTSRFDEAIAVLKAITVGTVLFVVATLDSGFSFTRVLMGIYWVATFVLVAGGRFGVRSILNRSSMPWGTAHARRIEHRAGYCSGKFQVLVSPAVAGVRKLARPGIGRSLACQPPRARVGAHARILECWVVPTGKYTHPVPRCWPERGG